MSDDVSVSFGANIQKLTSAIEEVNTAIGGITGPIKDVMSAAKEASAALGVAFAIDKVTEFVAAYAKVGEQVERTAAILGLSTRQTQELGYISEVTGGNADTMARSIERMQVNLQAAQNPTSRQAQALHALGLSASQLLALPLNEQLDTLADAFKRLHDNGVNPTSIAIEIMGRGAADMVPFLEQGRGGLDQLRQTALETGAIMSRETVEALAQNERASKTLWAALKGLAGTIAGELAPALTREDQGLAALIGNLNIAIQTHTLWERELIGIQTAASELGQALLNLGAIAKDVFTLNWGAIAADREAGLAKVAEIQRQGEERMNAVAKRAMEEYQTTLGGADQPLKSPSFAINTDAIKAAAEQYQQQIKAAQEAYSTTTKLADASYSSTKEHLSSELAQHQITYGQETALLLQALDERHAAESGALDKQVNDEKSAYEGRIGLYAQGTSAWQKAVDEETEALKKANDQRMVEDAKYFAERQKIVDQAAQQESKVWKSVADTMASAFSSQLQKILSGHETLMQGIERATGTMILKLLEDQVKLTAEWLLQNAIKLASHIATETGMTSATTAGAAARAAAQAASGQASILETIANAIKAIGAGAGQTAAEVSAAVAPEAGPAAPAIGAAAGTAVMAIGKSLESLDVGTDYVLSEGLAYIHRGEKIVPDMPAARTSGPYTGGRDGGDVHVHMPFNITAMDGRSVARVFNDNGGALLKAINNAARRGAHTGLRTARA